jgi:ATP-dependent DNA helicase RecG
LLTACLAWKVEFLAVSVKLANVKAFSKPLLGRLQKLGIGDTQGLLLHLPLRYIDETRISTIRSLRGGESAQVEGEIVRTEVQYKPRKTLISQLRDGTGQLTLRFLHFYPSQLKTLAEGKRLRVLGEVRSGFFGWEMVHPQCRPVDTDTPVSDSLTPVYPTTAGLSQAILRKSIAWALDQNQLHETLPAWVYQSYDFPAFADCLRMLHHPPADASIEQLQDRAHLIWRRLAYDELLAQQLSMRRHYARRRTLGAPALPASNKLITQLLKSLGFKLTNAQQKSALEITRDMMQPHPMQRLLQGDVGSGKTIVATMAALQAIEHGWQAAMMAPTEILAEQHYQKLTAWLTPLDIEVAWLAGSQTKKEREAALKQVLKGEARLVIGTHAIFQEQVEFAKLGLIIVDEQHRFGVQQRLMLRQKARSNNIEAPHQLMMSATPIPRTLSMSYYADLDVSVIDELPPGRSPIVTKLVSETRRDEVLQRIHEACLEGKQAYWVCPLIEESERLQLQTAMDTYAYMRSEFPNLQVGMIHGRMKASEKQSIMAQFSTNQIQLLVATTVIEVGVDVPNASLMVIEHAERMGLSQLHQLRGRVGRGAEKSTCILLYQTPLSEMARARLKVIYESGDGFEIAQADLHLRGPGEFLGVRQSGLPMLKIADLERDVDLLQAAKAVAERLLKEDPEAVEQHLQRWLGDAEDLVKV